MAHLKRPVIVSHWLDGRRVPAGTPGAEKRSKAASKWYGYGVPGRPKPVPLCADKRAAQQMLARLVAGGERAAAGLADPAAASLPLVPDLADRFAAAITAGTASQRRRRDRPDPEVARTARSRIATTCAGCGWRTPADLDPAGLSTWLAGRVARAGARGGMSAQTAEHYLQLWRRFARWLAAEARAGTAPELFDRLPGFGAAGKRLRPRRPATAAELTALFRAAGESPRTRRGLTGPHRRLLYLTAAATGLRRGELRRLTPANVRLDLDPPEVRLDARTKGRREVRQPLPPGVAAELAPLVAATPAGSPLWPGTWWEKSAKLLRHDLRAAGVPYLFDAGTGPKVLDLHSLRHGFATALVESGASVKEVQELLRHSDPRLTLAVYAHASRPGLAAAVGRIDPTVSPSPLAAVARPDLEATVAGLLLVVQTLLGLPAGLPFGPKSGESLREDTERVSGVRSSQTKRKRSGNTEFPERLRGTRGAN